MHDAVERGTVTEAGVRAEMDRGISVLVMALTEDHVLASFAERKQALRDQVRAAGREQSPSSPRTSCQTSAACNVGSTPRRERRWKHVGTTIACMASHYRHSVLTIEANDASSCFVPDLHPGGRAWSTRPASSSV